MYTVLEKLMTWSPYTRLEKTRMKYPETHHWRDVIKLEGQRVPGATQEVVIQPAARTAHTQLKHSLTGGSP